MNEHVYGLRVRILTAVIVVVVITVIAGTIEPPTKTSQPTQKGTLRSLRGFDFIPVGIAGLIPAAPAKRVPKPVAAKPKPVVHHFTARPRPVSKPKPTRGVCYVGQPCSTAGLTWKITHGCTKVWLDAQHRATCPINPATGQPWPLVG